ncbi:Hypothetical protein FKW44_013156, partial [Caligus rogercresseyi]
MRCSNGTLLNINCKSKDGHFDIIGIYGTNNDDTDFFNVKLSSIISHRPTIMAGDFNVKLKPRRDSNLDHICSNPRATKALISLISSFDFHDSADICQNYKHTFFSVDNFSRL